MNEDETRQLIEEVLEAKLAKLFGTREPSSAPKCGNCGSDKTNWQRRDRKSGSHYYVVRCRECGRTTNLGN